MKMCRCQEELLVAGRELCRHASDGGAVSRSKPGIDDERRPVSHDDRDVGPSHDRPYVVRDLDGVLAEHRLGLGAEDGGGKRCQQQ